MRLGDARASRVLGSACASHAGDGALAIANFSSFAREDKVRFGEAPKPAREAHALPRIAATLVVLLCVTACRRGMVDQQHLKPLAEETFFKNDAGSRVPPAHTVARGQLRADEQFYTGKIDNQLAATFPMPVTRELLSRGQQRFDIYCAVCHSRTGDGNGMIVQRGFPQPPSLHEQRLRDAPPGHFFDVITNGYGVMYPYASRVSPEDRWAIAAYIRALQLSQHAAPSDAEPAGLKQLQAAQP
jgi:mono/diheme cytochrome c family protein